MNNKKLIFIIIAGILLLGIIYLAMQLNSTSKPTDEQTAKVGDFKIWLLGDDNIKFNSVLEEFKLMNTNYAQTLFTIESFDNYEEYEHALAVALSRGEGPDLFVLNNNTESFADEQVLGIDPSVINPNDFRKKYKGVFGDELILSAPGDEGKQLEFLKGIPVGYETLGIYYNRKFVTNSSDLSTLSGLSNVVSKIKSKKSSLIPIGMGNGSTVEGVDAIISQFILLEDIYSLSDLTPNKLKQALSTYFMYGHASGENGYDSKFVSMKEDNKTNLDLFTRSETLMVIGYPRMLNEISQNGYSKSLLFAVPFPHYFEGRGKSLLDYNYFVINKDSSNTSLATDILKFLSSDKGATKYLDQFTYYLPALGSLESEKFESKIHPSYHITLGDFYDENSELASFNKGLKSVFDKEIENVLDDSSNYSELFDKMQKSINCKKSKIINLENLSASCE